MKRFSFCICIPIPGGVYIIADHELALEILKDAKTDKTHFWTFEVITGSVNVFTSPNNAYWKFACKATVHAFSKTEVSQMMQIATSNVQAWMMRLDRMIAENASFDPSFEMVKMTFDVICSAGFEYNPVLHAWSRT